MNKPEYIKQLKKLIKKYHPDLCTDDYLESAYNEITVKLVNKLNEAKNKNADTVQKTEAQGYNYKNGLVKVKEQDYAYYKLGIKYYKNIHPNYFYKRNTDTSFETKTYDEQLSVLNKIYLSFKLSEHYFNKIIEDYPQSSYFEDSREKIKLLKKLYKSYENIALEEKKVINSGKFVEEMGLKLM